MGKNAQAEILMREPGAGLAKIRSVYNSLSPAERKVADYILGHTVDFLYQSVNHVSKSCKTGESTVIRFCRSAGFSGFQELKLVLARDMAISKEHLQEPDSTAKDLASIMRQLSQETIAGIEDTFRLLDLQALERAIDAITKARRLEFYGVGASGITALDAQYKFMRIGITALAYTDPHLQAMSATTLGPDDVVVGISRTGALGSIVHSVRLARESGATTICVTCFAGSPITEVSDIVLLSGASEQQGLGTGSLKAKIAQIHVIDFLFTGVAASMKEKATYYSERTAKSSLNMLL